MNGDETSLRRFDALTAVNRKPIITNNCFCVRQKDQIQLAFLAQYNPLAVNNRKDAMFTGPTFTRGDTINSDRAIVTNEGRTAEDDVGALVIDLRVG